MKRNEQLSKDQTTDQQENGAASYIVESYRRGQGDTLREEMGVEGTTAGGAVGRDLLEGSELLVSHWRTDSCTRLLVYL